MSLHSSELSSSENTSPLNLGWREKRYARFYQSVDLLVDQIQHHAYANTGKPKRKVRGAELEKLHYSVDYYVKCKPLPPRPNRLVTVLYTVFER